MRRGTDFVWVVDPLDGTTNYSNSIPVFTVSIALTYRGRSVTGVVYAPYFNELFYNKGNDIFTNKNRVNASKKDSLENSLIYFGFNSFDPAESEEGVKIFNALAETEGVRLRKIGCSSLCLAYIAAGRGDAYVDPHMKPWDMAGAGLFVEKVGKITGMKGGEWNPFSKGAVASNGRIHDKILEILKGVI